MIFDLDDPLIGVTAEEVNRAWETGEQGGRMEIKRRFMLRNLKIAIEHAEDFATLRKAMVRQMEFIR